MKVWSIQIITSQEASFQPIAEEIYRGPFPHTFIALVLPVKPLHLQKDSRSQVTAIIICSYSLRYNIITNEDFPQ
jgi:hypothetical protein